MKNTEDRGVAPKELATQLGVSYDIIKRRIRKLFPEITKRGRKTWLNAEQVAAIKKRINREDGYLSIRELADQLGVNFSTIKRRQHELFPSFTPERKATWLNAEQVEAIKKRVVDTTITLGQPSKQLEQMDTVITTKQLSKQLGHSVKFIRRCIHELFPGLIKPGITTLLNDEQVALIQSAIATRLKLGMINQKNGRKAALMNKKLVYKKLIQALKSEGCYTQSQIASYLDLTEDELFSLMKGYKFVEYEPFDDEMIWVYWPEIGVYIKEPGILVKIPPQKTRTEGYLLRYPQNETPLQQGITRRA
jgi:DNA-binding transcriptional regulator YhcF (GntR family)